MINNLGTPSSEMQINFYVLQIDIENSPTGSFALRKFMSHFSCMTFNMKYLGMIFLNYRNNNFFNVWGAYFRGMKDKRNDFKSKIANKYRNFFDMVIKRINENIMKALCQWMNISSHKIYAHFIDSFKVMKC